MAKLISQVEADALPAADGDACPQCGKRIDCNYDGPNFVASAPPRFNMGAAMEYGGNPQDWTEVWRCPGCGCEFSVEDSNF